MKDIKIFALLFVIATGAVLSATARSQQPQIAPDLIESKLPEPELVKLYGQQQGLTEPILFQSVYTPPSACNGSKGDGKVVFSFVVDSEGRPRNVVFEKALANEIDLLALKIMLGSKFRPAALNGSPVAVGGNMEMRLSVCIEQSVAQSGETKETIQLDSMPENKFKIWKNPPSQANLAPISIPPGVHADQTSHDVVQPKLLVHPHPPDAKGRSGDFSFLILVDEHGIPQIVKLLKSTDQTLLPQITSCIRNIRYKPALKDGMPVPAIYNAGLEITSEQ